MKVTTLNTLKKRLYAKLKLFLRWNTDQGIPNYGSHGSRRVRKTIFQILKLEAKIENLEQSQALEAKIENLEQSQQFQASPGKKRKKQPTKEDFSFNKKANPKMLKIFRDKFENATIIIPELDEKSEEISKLSIKFESGEISINNYQVLPCNYYFKYWGKYKKTFPQVSSKLHALYEAIGLELSKK